MDTSAQRLAGGLPLVLALGNHDYGDDAAGLEIARRLRAHGLAPERFIAAPHTPLDWEDIARAGRPVLILDSVFSGGAPGTVYLAPIPGTALQPRGAAALSTHGIGLLESLRLAQALGVALPRLVLVGIECGDVSPGAPLSPAVESAIAHIVENFSELQQMIAASDFRLESVQPWPARDVARR